MCALLFWRFIRNRSDKWYLIVIEKATCLKIEKYNVNVLFKEDPETFKMKENTSASYKNYPVKQ